MGYEIRYSASATGDQEITMGKREEIEAALKEGRLFVAMANGRWWRARRNGATQTWKTRPGHFSIPVKAGLKACVRLGHDSIEGSHYRT